MGLQSQLSFKVFFKAFVFGVWLWANLLRIQTGKLVQGTKVLRMGACFPAPPRNKVVPPTCFPTLYSSMPQIEVPVGRP